MPQTVNVFANLKNNAGKNVRGLVDPQGAQDNTQRHGKFAAAVLAGANYEVSNLAATALTVALALTYTGLVITNPTGSGVNLIIQKVGLSFPVAPAAGQSIGLFAGAGAPTHTTPQAIKNNIAGNAITGSLTVADVAATLPAGPFWTRWIGGFPAVAGAGALIDVDGEVVVPAGFYLGIGGLIASGAAGFLGSLSWEEVPQ